MRRRARRSAQTLDLMRRSIAVTVLAVASILSLPIRAGDSDATLRQKLVGDWQEIRRIDCEEHHQFTTLSANGSFEVRDSIEGCIKRTFIWRGTWSVVHGKFRYTATSSGSPHDVPIGVTLEDEIISVSEAEWVMLEQSTGNKSVAKRVRRS
jgi:hypothetical protein